MRYDKTFETSLIHRPKIFSSLEVNTASFVWPGIVIVLVGGGETACQCGSTFAVMTPVLGVFPTKASLEIILPMKQWQSGNIEDLPNELHEESNAHWVYLRRGACIYQRLPVRLWIRRFVSRLCQKSSLTATKSFCQCSRQDDSGFTYLFP